MPWGFPLRFPCAKQSATSWDTWPGRQNTAGVSSEIDPDSTLVFLGLRMVDLDIPSKGRSNEVRDFPMASVGWVDAGQTVKFILESQGWKFLKKPVREGFETSLKGHERL